MNNQREDNPGHTDSPLQTATQAGTAAGAATAMAPASDTPRHRQSTTAAESPVLASNPIGHQHQERPVPAGGVATERAAPAAGVITGDRATFPTTAAELTPEWREQINAALRGKRVELDHNGIRHAALAITDENRLTCERLDIDGPQPGPLVLRDEYLAKIGEGLGFIQ